MEMMSHIIPKISSTSYDFTLISVMTFFVRHKSWEPFTAERTIKLWFQLWCFDISWPVITFTSASLQLQGLKPDNHWLNNTVRERWNSWFTTGRRNFVHLTKAPQYSLEILGPLFNSPKIEPPSAPLNGVKFCHTPDAFYCKLRLTITWVIPLLVIRPCLQNGPILVLDPFN